jgi:hypothetical protein
VDPDVDPEHRAVRFFSSDRTIRDYRERIWRVDPVRVPAAE